MKIQLVIVALLVVLCFAPVMAQEATVNRVTFNDVSFSVDESLARNFNIKQIPADDPTIEVMGAPAPEYTSIMFYNQENVYSDVLDYVGDVYIFHIPDFDPDYEGYQYELGVLQGLIDQQTDLTPYMEAADDRDYLLPYFPIGGGAVQILRARTAYFETDELVGLRYLVAYTQDMSPFSSRSFRYVFEAISKDGRYLVSAIFNLSTSVFPEEPSYDNFDYETFAAEISDYVRESSAQLTAASPDDFTPSLDLLDAVGLSLVFED